MNRPALVAVVGFVTLFAFHHDVWNWDNDRLVLGFMPVGLAYHAGYSIVVAIFWGLVMKFAWPADLEEWASGSDGEPDNSSTDR